MILQPFPIHRTNLFEWLPETKIFVADASELRWGPGWPKLGRVYDDAADEGFTLVSDKTGVGMTMVLDQGASEYSNDFSGGWKMLVFSPAEQSKRDACKVIVYND